MNRMVIKQHINEKCIRRLLLRTLVLILLIYIRPLLLGYVWYRYCGPFTPYGEFMRGLRLSSSFHFLIFFFMAWVGERWGWLTAPVATYLSFVAYAYFEVSARGSRDFDENMFFAMLFALIFALPIGLWVSLWFSIFPRGKTRRLWAWLRMPSAMCLSFVVAFICEFSLQFGPREVTERIVFLFTFAVVTTVPFGGMVYLWFRQRRGKSVEKEEINTENS